jgi:DNA polymerase-3 subunit gamma/tau
MAYTVLARRYRSQTFGDVVGQDAVAQTLINAIESNRVAHAYLFTGTRGVGKTTMARVLAKSLNCLKHDEPTIKPCCKCDSCIAVNLGEDLDVIEIDGASNNSVDNIRELRQNAIYRPARSRFKIYIIDEVHMLSTSAFNALLKILEEPPEHVKFIFATTEPNKVLPTVQSRCQRFDFGAICPADITKQLKMVLKTEKIKAENDLILHLARLANGSMRDALSLLDQLISAGTEPLTLELLEEFLGEPNRQKITNLLSSIATGDAAASLGTVDELLATGLTCTQIADSLIDFMRDLMVIKSTDPKSDLLVLTADERKQMTELAGSFDLPGLIYNITTLEKLRWTIKNSDNSRALMEASVLRLTLSEHFMGIEHLMSAATRGGLKKKRPLAAANNSTVPASRPSANTPPAVATATPTEITAVISGDVDLAAIQQKFGNILNALKQPAPQIANRLANANPTAFDDNVLTLAYPDEFNRGMCEKSADQIAEAISKAIGRKVKLKFELSESKPETPAEAIPGAKISQEKRDEITSDPAVQMVLNRLNANVTDIEQIS